MKPSVACNQCFRVGRDGDGSWMGPGRDLSPPVGVLVGLCADVEGCKARAERVEQRAGELRMQKVRGTTRGVA